MSESSTYQQLRGHLAALRLSAAAAALPAELDRAATDNLGHTAFLERLLAIEVTATEARRQASLARFACLPAPSPHPGSWPTSTSPPVTAHLVLRR
jgi:DNA replication protein DnaC